MMASLLGLLVAAPAAATTYLVGDTDHDGCDFSSIQDAIDAAAANGFYGNHVRVTNSGTYTGQALRIGDTTLLIEGGFDSCSGQHAAPAADIGGNGVDPVIQFVPTLATQQTLSLISLHIHGGGSSGLDGSAGGGVYLTNNTRLFTTDTYIEGNAARDGGGIYIDGASGAPYVQLDAGTRISGNVASLYGGGVTVAGGTLDIAADNTAIDHNTAGDAGGGIAALQGHVQVGNPFNLSASSDAHGALVAGNTAGALGGGIFLYGPAAVLNANELIIDGNTAAVGGGGLAASSGAQAWMQRDYANSALQCPGWRECSRISNNSVGGGATGTIGGGIALYSGAFAQIAQTIVRGNTASAGSAAYVDSATLFLEGVLLTGNTAFENAYGQQGGTLQTGFADPAKPSTLRVAYATFAGNVLELKGGGPGSAFAVNAQKGSQLSLYSSALYDSHGVAAYSTYTDDCVIEPTQAWDALGTHTRNLFSDTPGFNKAATGDFRLRSESALNDYCDASRFQASFRDLALTPRCHDDPRRADTYGKCDVGAYESDHIFGAGLQ